MNDALVVMIWLAFIGGSLLITVVRANAQRERIIEHLTSIGANEISARYRFFDFDKTNFTYDVSYRDGAGKHQQTVCKVRGGWWHDQTLYWDRVPQRTEPAGAVRKTGSGSTRSASPNTAMQNQKDAQTLIAELAAENARLRAALDEKKMAA